VRPDPGAEPAADPFVTSVVTPEAVLLQFRPAGLGSRMLAITLDLLIQLVLLLAVSLAVLVATGGAGGTAAVIIVTLALFLIIFGYPVAVETLWDGRSVGKRALGLRVITTEGGPVRFRHAAIRALLFTVDAWIPPGGITGLTAALLTRRGQRLGDLAAGTIVVRVRGAADRIEPVWFAPPVGHEGYVAHLDVSGLTARQYQLVRRFLLRSTELSPPARWRVASRLASGTAAAVTGAVPSGMHPETYLLCVVAAYQARAGGTAGSGTAHGPPPPRGPAAGGEPPPAGRPAAPPPEGPPVALAPPVGLAGPPPPPAAAGPPPPPAASGPPPPPSGPPGDR
jgi:uncharacterized RDD family membrane protein YckC